MLKILPMILLAAAAARPSAPPDIEPLVAAARALPPTFAADSLLRLAAAREAGPARATLIVEAFAFAAQAQPRYPLESVFASSASAPFLAKASLQQLDALDLQLRAVQAMAASDPARARQLFQQIPSPDLPKLACADWEVPDPAPYYREMAALVRTFSPAEARSGQPGRFLQPHTAIRSPLEAGPMADVLAGAGLDTSEFRPLLASFSASVAKISGDDRSFTAARDAGRAIQSLVQECQRLKLSPQPLVAAYRLFLVRHLSASRCVDDAQTAALGQSAFATPTSPPSNTADFFNRQLAAAPVPPIREQESTPSHLEGVAVGLAGCTQEICRSLGEQFHNLVFAPDGRMLSPAERARPEWNQGLDRLLAALAEWKPGADPGAWYRQKASAYAELLPLPPAGGQARVAAAEVEFLIQAKSQAANPAEWFLPLNRLLAWTVVNATTFAHFAAGLRQSPDPVVSFYARLEQALPRSPDRLIPLL